MKTHSTIGGVSHILQDVDQKKKIFTCMHSFNILKDKNKTLTGKFNQ